MCSHHTVHGISILLWAGGCLNLGGGRSPATRYYLFMPEGRASSPAESSVVGVLVGSVTLPGCLDRLQIVTRQGGERLHTAEFDRWAEPLG